jgi:chromosome segregation ATPase
MKKITIQSKIATLAVLGSLVLGSVPAFAQTSTDAQKPVARPQGWLGARPYLNDDIKESREEVKDARREVKEGREEVRSGHIELISNEKKIREEAKDSISEADNKEEIKKIREEAKKEITSARTSFRSDREEKMSTLKESVRFLLVKELSFAYSQTTNLFGRVEKKITEMKANGVDVSKAETNLAESKVSLETAMGSIEKIKTVLSEEGKDKAELKVEIKDLIASAKLNLHEARQSLKEVIDFIKESQKPATESTDSQ